MPSNHTQGDRLWRSLGCQSDPPIPEWLRELWNRYGRPTEASKRYSTEGQALLWFASEWASLRPPYSISLPQELIDWLNATEIDLTQAIVERPAIGGSLRCASPKLLSRFMYTVAQQHDRFIATANEYYDFLAWYAFSFMPERNIPRVLLPAAVVSLLNAPADGDEVPLTVGMMLYLKQVYPEELNIYSTQNHERLLALSFCAVEGILAIGQLRLVPMSASSFWRRLPLKLVTAFEYVAAHANGLGNGRSPTTKETDVRNWFQTNVVKYIRGTSVMSGLSTHEDSLEPSEPLADNAVVIYRDHETVCGLSNAGAAAREALLGSGMRIFDVHFSLKRECLDAEFADNRRLWINARRRLHLINVNPELIPECCLCNAGRMWPQDYVIGQFYWELSRISKMHESGIALMDEVWAASRYLTDIYARDTGKPVFTMGQAVTVQEPATPLDRKAFGFTDEAYLFLCNFDVQSVVERKNPLGTIIAFQNAFPRGREPVGLIIKTRNLEHFCTQPDRDHWAKALECIRKDSRIHIIADTMSADALAALYLMCDCFVSLHRSEGFGFGPAEAMAHGRPVIVTNYSGVCDFCTTETAKLVPYELIRVREDEYPYLDADRVYEWADPDLRIAAECMRELAEDREQSLLLGRAGQEFVSRQYSVSALRRRYLDRLEALGFAESARPAAVHPVDAV